MKKKRVGWASKGKSGTYTFVLCFHVVVASWAVVDRMPRDLAKGP